MYVQCDINWSDEEDEKLIAAVNENGRDWAVVSKKVGSEDGVVKGKNPRICKQRAEYLLEQGKIVELSFPDRTRDDLERRLREREEVLAKLKKGGHNPKYKQKILSWGKNMCKSARAEIVMAGNKPSSVQPDVIS